MTITNKVVLLGVISVYLCTSCRTNHVAETDGTTGATKVYGKNEIVLPPPSGDYEVLGSQKGLKGFAIRYDGKLYRGGEPYDDSAAQTLHDWGVKTIISITPTELERKFCHDHGFQLIEIPFSKTKGPTVADLNRFKNTIQTGSGPFYMHCVGGSHRGGVLGVTYRTHLLDWPYEKALVEYGRLGGDLKGDHNMLEAVRDAK
ncbi:MAG: hypothetical protein OES84_04435 [Kiritimatiellaceae bacterium]|nr:hypothetical protein [Kiritimatiellaceae bacterium]